MVSKELLGILGNQDVVKGEPSKDYLLKSLDSLARRMKRNLNIDPNSGDSSYLVGLPIDFTVRNFNLPFIGEFYTGGRDYFYIASQDPSKYFDPNFLEEIPKDALKKYGKLSNGLFVPETFFPELERRDSNLLKGEINGVYGVTSAKERMRLIRA
jgi:hypothetical protein